MSDPMQEIRAAFFVECEELLEALQDGLEEMSGGEGDDETINVVFRAVHSIKGGAGAFGLDRLVGFAHKFETALDEVRAGRLTADEGAHRLFFRCADILQDLVGEARDGTEVDAGVTDPVLAELAALTGVEDEEEEEEVDFTPASISFDLGGDGDAGGLPDLPALPPLPDLGPGTEVWRIRFAPDPALYESLNEPLLCLRALSGLGEMTVTTRARGDVPALADYDAAQALTAFDIRLETDVEEAAIREVFEFVDGLCELSIARGEEEPGDREPDDGKTVDRDTDGGETDGGSGKAPDARSVAPGPAAPAPAVPAPDASAPDLPPPSRAGATPPSGVIEMPVPKPASVAAPKADAPAKEKGGGGSATVRVDLDRIDRLVNLVGELVINQAMLAQSVSDMGLTSSNQVSAGLDEFQQLTRSIQESVMMIRAQPVKSLFQRMGRIVREAASATGKEVRLTTEGDSTEIDKTVIERLSDPLTHMIRNAVDHGLETPDRRRAAGKAPRGEIRLSAAHRSGRVVIEISDDGAGINRPKVKKIAEEKGLIPPDQALSDSEIDALLFLPGFSTAAEVSALSGRGVGMDVVKSSITALGGRITTQSTPGAGSTFTISLPLTLAVLDGMVVTTAGETLVVPLGSIVETLKLETGTIKHLGPDEKVVQVRDEFVPLLDLARRLGYRDASTDYTGSIALLIAQEDGRRAALVVDGIDDQRQVVIKGLEDSYGRIPGVAAATILGDGQIALILDPTDLIVDPGGPAPAADAHLKATG